MKKIVFLVAIFSLLTINSTLAQTPLWQGKGRIAISSDGNEHDDDDWAATPLTLALIASQGLQDQMVLYTYSDHIWGNNQEQGIKHGMTAYEHMRESALGGKEHFGFDNSTFICAVDAPAVAYRAMAEAINESSEDNPLIIIAAGPMQVVGEGINQADKSKLKYVTVLSHSGWNNNHADKCYKHYWDQHTGWTFDEMKKAFGPTDKGGVTFIQIKDQNHGANYEGLQAPILTFDWIKTSKARNHKAYQDGSWDWLYSRIESCIKTENGVKSYDPSDAGMIVYLFTGIDETDPEMARELMENPQLQ